MKFLDKIGLILLLIIAAILADTNNVVQSGDGIIANSTLHNQTITDPSINDGDQDDDDGTVYVCGIDGIDNKCTCKNERLDCNHGYSNYFDQAALKHSKIKICNESFTAKIVDLSYNRMTYLRKDEILPGHESTIVELDLYFNDVETIEDGAFDKFTSLKKLGLKYNSLKSINDTFFTKQVGSTLEELDLSKNFLQNFTTNDFRYLTKLTVLDLNTNKNINLITKINGINVTIFPEALSNLKKLNLDYCNIEYLDDNVFINLRSLQHLDISHSLFATVPKAIRSLSHLQHLYIYSSKIVSINDCDFCGLSNLITLSLRESFNLKYIDENAFGALNNKSTIPQLDKFSIAYCSVSILPEKLLNWKNVSRIDIRFNPLECNCSIAWLINDFNSSKPLYVNNLRSEWGGGLNKNMLYCHSPSSTLVTHLHTLAGNFCLNDTAAVKDKDDVYYVCDENAADEEDTEVYKGCSCWDKSLECSDSSFALPNKKLNHTNIKILKDNFTLEYVKLNGNNITSLNTDKVLPGNEHAVTYIDVSSNNINHIENRTFEKFSALFQLNLNDNNLTNIDTVIFPSSLQQLHLRNTNLDHIPKNDFSNLTFLNLSENLKIFSSTNVDFSKHFSKLEILALYNCNITTLDENAFVHLQSLKMLFIGDNPFTAIPTALRVLQNLHYLNLDGTNITTLKNNSLATFKNLQHLSVHGSKLQRIADCAFCNLQNLSYLTLTSNLYLSYIHENAFGSITLNKPFQLYTLSIEYCNISTLPEKLLDWRNISKLIIKGNPLTCNCSLAWLINDYNATKPLYVDNLKYAWWSNDSNKNDLYCHNPPELRNEYLHTLAGDFCLNEKIAMEEEKTYQVCGENDDDATDSICTCENNNLNCDSMNTTNIEITTNKTIEIKRIIIAYGNISYLNLNKLLPKRQHQIEYLSFYNSNISSIENGTFNNFIALKRLDLSGNNLTLIDENILTEQLGSTLIELNLGMNNLNPFTSKTFIHLTKLETLKLHFNPEIGNSLTSKVLSSSLASLQHLALAGCNISNLSDDEFINLRNLTYLGLSRNPITTFPTAINALPNLQLLEIINNDITVLSKKNLKINKNLKYLFAQQSKIQRIEECAFCNFPNLKHIDLDRNENLSFIHENAFGYAHSHLTPSLSSLRINRCNITALPEKLFNWTFVEFHVYRNPFICDCSMNWFIKLVKSEASSSFRLHYRCHGPAELEGRSFYGLTDIFCNESAAILTSPATSTLPSTITAVTDASATSIHSYRQLIILILSVFIVIAMATVAAGIYCYRSRRVIHSRKNGQDGEEDLLEEDFDVENV